MRRDGISALGAHIEAHKVRWMTPFELGRDLDPCVDDQYRIIPVSEGQQVVRDDTGKAVMLVTASRRAIRLFGVTISDTVRTSVRKRPLSDLIGHSLIAPGTPWGMVPVRSVEPEEWIVGMPGEIVRLRHPLPSFDASVLPTVEVYMNSYVLPYGELPPFLRKIES